MIESSRVEQEIMRQAAWTQFHEFCKSAADCEYTQAEREYIADMIRESTFATITPIDALVTVRGMNVN